MEQPVSGLDDWETMVRYNEKILQKDQATISATNHPRQEEKIISPQTEVTRESRLVSGVQRPDFKPPEPPKPTSPKRLLPVQLFLNRQVLDKLYSAMSASMGVARISVLVAQVERGIESPREGGGSVA